MRRLLLLLVCLGLVGCTTSKRGTGTAAVAPGPPSTSSAPVAPSVPAPTTTSTPSAGTTVAHPVDLAAIRPCKLFTKAVNTVAGTVVDHPPLKVQLPTMPDAPACFENNADRNVGLIIAVSTTVDLNDFDQSRGAGADVQRFTAKGYPAVSIAPRSVPAVCFGGVGMADHQLLFLQYALASPISTPKMPQKQLCARLRPIAQQVVSQLTR